MLQTVHAKKMIMNRVDKIWTDLKELTTNTQVLSYWDKRQTRIVESLNNTLGSNFETATKIIHRLAKSLNDKERYSDIYYLYKTGFQPIENKLPKSDNLNEVKFELGRGLHHNRKYDHSKRLFNELASSDFDTSRIDGWWNQTAFASTRDKIWIKTDVLPSIGTLILIIAYILVAVKTKEFLITTTVFIILFEFYETWWYQYRISNYLKEFQDLSEIIDIKKNLKKKILIELGISLLFYPIYFLRQEWLLPLVLIIAVYFQIFHYGLNYYYLPKLIGGLNRNKARHANTQ
jgi:hypothetical protein